MLLFFSLSWPTLITHKLCRHLWCLWVMRLSYSWKKYNNHPSLLRYSIPLILNQQKAQDLLWLQVGGVNAYDIHSYMYSIWGSRKGVYMYTVKILILRCFSSLNEAYYGWKQSIISLDRPQCHFHGE